ncbi:hypothetical protein ABIB83_005452 [Bradyrhizobium sp. I1.8.5]|uniref:hypothetical protein n=1 Tax=Bradyrhizobium sp. I1.8.5 TaxID=3156365 RepID=UPI003397ADDB
MPSTPLTRIILVHGTWGRGFWAKRLDQPALLPLDVCGPSPDADIDEPCKSERLLRWFETGSAFHVELTRAMHAEGLEFNASSFLWNSNNSIVDRNDAAVCLARHIRSLQAEAPNDLILIIAHSHGGNVAVRAIHIAGAAHTGNVKLVTLATPFLKIATQTMFEEADEGWLPTIPAEMPLSPSGRALVEMFLTAGFLIFGLAVLFLLFPASELRHVLKPSSSDNSWDYVKFLALLLVPILITEKLTNLLIKLVVNPQINYPKNWGSSKHGFDAWAYKPDKLANLTFYQIPPRKKEWLLVLRGVDDEATLALASGSIGNLVFRYTLNTALPVAGAFLSLLSILLVLLSLGILLLGNDPTVSKMTDHAAGLIAIIVGIGLPIIGLVCFLLPGLFRAPCGKEMFLGAWRCEVSVDSVPDAVDGIQIRTLPVDVSDGASRVLRHYLHGHPNVVPAVVDWLRGAKDVAQGR